MKQMLFGDWAERSTINRNAEHLSSVEANVTELRKVIGLQTEEITRLRAMMMVSSKYCRQERRSKVLISSTP